MAELSAADIRRAAMDLLARREHSTSELSTKLTRRFGERLTNPELLGEQLERGRWPEELTRLLKKTNSMR